MNPVVSVERLAEQLDDPDLRIIDCRFELDDPTAGRRRYEAGHIPGAVYVSLDDDLSAPPSVGRHPLPDLATFAQRFGDLGVGDSHRVVAYDDAGGAHAARLWWMRRAAGHPRVTVLDGGWRAWVTAGLPISDETPSYAPAPSSAVTEWPDVIERGELANRLDEVTLIDARAPERYRGEVEPLDPVAGHIPGAINLPYAGNLGRDGRFLPPGDLRSRYGTAAGGQVVVYCGSGVTACHDILAMELAGIDGALLYPGSWSDWSTAGGAVATGGAAG